MATNIQVIPHLSPRIIKILAPTTVISVQELSNQIKDWEDEPSNLSYPVLISTSGKENLGGGVLVGITAELQNAKIMFEARTESDFVGTYTGSDYPDPSKDTLIDDNANFTYIVSPGDTVINITTGAVATILSVDSATQISHEPLDDGIVNTWTYGDEYKIWNKIQCEINGGNLVAVDENGEDTFPFLPSAFTHVIRTSASSATLQEQQDIQYSSFQNGVWIDTINGVSGTAFPTGTPRQPVNNLTDANTIAINRGFTRYIIIGDIIFSATDNIDGFEIVGEDVNKTKVTLTAGVSTSRTEFVDCELVGNISGAISVRDCHLETLTDIGSIDHETIFLNCVFEEGTYTFLNSGTETVQFIICSSGVPGISPPVFDHNSTNAPILVRSWNGGMEFQNITSPYPNHSFDINSGNVIFDSTCTDGSAILRGITLFTDNSGPNFTLNTDGVVNPETIANATWDENIEATRSTKSFGKKLIDILKLKRTTP